VVEDADKDRVKDNKDNKDNVLAKVRDEANVRDRVRDDEDKVKDSSSNAEENE
jgi:hypothetical protein